MNQYAAAVRSSTGPPSGRSDAVHQSGVQSALAHTPTQVRDYIGGKAPTGVTLPDFGPETWGTISKKAYEKAVGYLDQQGAPLRDLVEKMGKDTLHAVQMEWGKGMALGYNPKKIAKNIENATANIALGRARTIARTEFHRAYRQTKAEQIDASDVTQGWVWKANLDGGTCGLCVAMSGSIHPKGDVMDSHPNCRCTMVPLDQVMGRPRVPSADGGRGPAGGAVHPVRGRVAHEAARRQDSADPRQGPGQDSIDKAFSKAGGDLPLAKSTLRGYVMPDDEPGVGADEQLRPFTKPGKMPMATGPAPTPPPLPVKVPPAPKPAPMPKAAPVVTATPPVASKAAPLIAKTKSIFEQGDQGGQDAVDQDRQRVAAQVQVGQPAGRLPRLGPGQGGHRQAVVRDGRARD